MSKGICPLQGKHKGMSKIAGYENPYIVKGNVKYAGSKEAPKGICKDKINGTWKCYNTRSTDNSISSVV